MKKDGLDHSISCYINFLLITLFLGEIVKFQNICKYEDDSEMFEI